MELFEVYDEESGRTLEIEAETLEEAIAISEKTCAECGYVEDMVAIHFEECSKLEGDFMCVNCGGGFTRDEIVTDEDGDDFCNSCK
jgi:ubiquitin